jgi:multidrug efflux pump
VISRFFIDRPIFAAVLSVVITLLGAVALVRLPITQYPRITPPTIRVSTYYPGASAQVLAESVAAPIEQQVNGVEDMLYMSSQCTNDGNYALSVTFKPGVDLNFAQVLVQNRVSLAIPALPDVVKAAGVQTRKRNPDILLLVSVYSPDGRYNQLYLNNYANIHLKDELARLEGVADIALFSGQDYSMRVWVDPEKLAVRGVTAGEVVKAVSQQNSQIAAGQLGHPPASLGQQQQLPLKTLGRLTDPEQFEHIVIRTTPDGRLLRIRDIGYAELGAKNQDIVSYLDGKPCANIALFQLPDANALDTAERIRAKMDELKKSFPAGVDYDIVYDTTPFVRDSILEVFKTLGDSIVLVALVVLVFLQNWRASLIPLVAVPVAIVGTFAAMAAFGFSLNMLTLFGLVLAVGIVVDDAIVVVEAVGHHIEQGMAPRAATYKAMEEVSGPVIAVGLVLSAVFVPCAFISGITGQFFRQFALTIAVSTVISAFNSLTLSPALCAILLKPRGARRDPLTWLLDLTLGWFFRLFNFSFRKATGLYTIAVGWALRLAVLVLVVYGGLVLLTWWGFRQLPLGYIPAQDQGKLYVAVQLPDSSSLERTKSAMRHIDEIVRSTPGVAHTITASGQSFTLSAYGSNFGQFFVTLSDFDERSTPDLTSNAIAANLRQRIERDVPEASIAVLGPPPVAGLGTSGGFKIMIEDRSDLGLQTLQEQTDQLIDLSAAEPEFSKVFTISRMKSPQLFVDVNREQCARYGVQLRDVFTTLQVYLGSAYVNDLNLFEHTWQVNVQALGPYRNDVDDIRRLMVRNKQGLMVPLGAVTTVRWINGPLLLTRYNMYPAITVNGATRPDVSSGEGIRAMEDLANRELPQGMAFEWTEITYLQLLAGNTAMVIFALAVIGVFLVLAALYESWALPLAVILVVPICLLGSITGTAVTHSDINIFTQIGFVVLVGLASKNAILIVEFAKVKREAGEDRRRATLEACRLRLRPILMTSFAFILGVLPLMLSAGAGAEMRRTLGTAVFSGMLGVTAFGIFLTPVFFYVIDWVGELSLLGSPQLRGLILAVLVLLGLTSLALVELLLFISWYHGVLSLVGAVSLSAALFGILVLLALRFWWRQGAARLPVDMVKQRWMRRSQPNGLEQARELHQGNDGNGSSMVARVTQGPGESAAPAGPNGAGVGRSHGGANRPPPADGNGSGPS